MNFWETITGSDLTREWKEFDARAQALPDDYRAAWRELTTRMMPYGDFAGRNLTPIMDGALGLLEESAAEGLSVQDVLGGDVAAFASALAGEEGSGDFRDKWRRQLNRNVARKLAQLGE
ncbi:DUF1048 domain-containing protein [Microbacterium sp. NEAU-LLC]|uniref:DUF1048 domain-containing protein n=1 Tax=Microbacterium helvum TaxID=2773713 RepID=A0ABR8NSF4_9MICO|nr:DUF1048 domain-containing protein [Microbacterium helvum]MBD3943540.1 DUF1048 domain-containing protein [Microbacterium helvum]